MGKATTNAIAVVTRVALTSDQMPNCGGSYCGAQLVVSRNLSSRTAAKNVEDSYKSTPTIKIVVTIANRAELASTILAVHSLASRIARALPSPARRGRRRVIFRLSAVMLTAS